MESVPEQTAMDEKLSLYCRDWCGACFIVKRYIKKLGLNIEIRDICKQPERFNELVAARGRGTVPVLRRDLSDGRSDWMPESRDIVHYLVEKYGS